MKVKILIHLLFIGFGISPLIAQNYREEIGKITQKIESSDSYHITGKISVYADSKGNNLIRQFEADVQRNKNGYRSRIDDTEVISNDKMVITVDHEERYIQVENQPKLSRNDENFLKEINQLGNQDSTIISTDLIETVQDVNTYRLLLKGDITMVEISLNVKKLSIDKIAYFYDEKKFPVGNYVVIVYNNFLFDKTLGEDLIQGKDVIQKSGTKITPVGKYEKYHLVNLYQD